MSDVAAAAAAQGPAVPWLGEALRDWLNVLRRTRGRWLFGLMGILPVLIVLPTIAHGGQGPSEALTQGQLIMRVYDLDVARRMFDCPMGLALLALLLFGAAPLSTLVLAYDAAVSPVPDGLSLRARVRLVVGKVLGICGAFAVLSVLPCALVSLLEATKGHVPAGTVLAWTATIYVVATVLAAPVTALWILVSAACRSTWRSLLGGVALAIALCLGRGYLHTKASPYEGVLPNALELSLLSVHIDRALLGLAVAAAWIAAGVAATVAVARRRSA
jgi:hypothetical protein